MSVAQLTQKYLAELSTVQINIGDKSINLINELAQIPRSGKAVRIDTFGLNLPKRSLLDHIINLGNQSDILLTALGLDIDKPTLARMLAYHDLVEIIAGDTPDFTTPELGKNTYRLPDDKKTAERIAAEIICRHIPTKLQPIYNTTLNQLHNSADCTVNFFHLVDKIDPILAVWRYICIFRVDLNIDQFLGAMSDFFVNPNVITHSINSDTADLIEFLQNKNNAKRYHA